MTKTVLLNNVEHAKLRVLTDFSAEYGDNVNQVLTFPTEYGDIQKEYPILIQKTESGEFESVAILGLDREENLFLEGNYWNANHIPAIIQRGPFLIGMQKKTIEGEETREPMVHIDLENPRVNEEAGEPVFLEHGGNSPYLTRMTSLLKSLYQGISVGNAMFTAFSEMNLIEPLTMTIKLSDTEQYNIEGYYTINEKRLVELDGPSLEKLNRSGFLRGAFFIIASLTNFNKLIALKNKKRFNETT